VNGTKEPYRGLRLTTHKARNAGLVLHGSVNRSLGGSRFFKHVQVKSVCIEVDLEDPDCERPCKKPKGKRGKERKPPGGHKDDKDCGC